MARTFKNIQDEIIVKLKENATTPRWWTLDEIKLAINDTYIFIADELKCFKDTYSDVIINNFKLPDDYVTGTIERVEIDDKAILPVSVRELDEYNQSWKEISAKPTNYIEPGELGAFDEINFFPYPDLDTYTCVVYYAKYPTLLVNDGDEFDNPIKNNPRSIITHGAMALLFLKEGEGKDIQKASFENKRFAEACDAIGNRPKTRNKSHRMLSITDCGGSSFNLGSNYPFYPR